MSRIALPEHVEIILEKLNRCGFEAYAVGGAVRDSLEGGQPDDWDLCTAATPEEMMDVFQDMRTIPTGIQHGTLTVVSGGRPVEVTTFRTDGDYSDGRHPDEVFFVRNIREDLARRDFTVNAMAYSPSAGLLDLFGGTEDLKEGVIRCVGDPVQRFSEDGLRIMRALRFLSVKGYSADPDTAAAIHQCRGMLREIAPERIRAELMKFLAGQQAAKYLDEYRDVFAVIIPELEPMFDFAQHSPYHNRDVWHHTLAALDYIEPDPELRFTMLVHDIAKPVLAWFDETGRGHFRGHPGKSAEMAAKIMAGLRFPKASMNRIITLVRYHDTRFEPDRMLVRKLLRDFGETVLRDLMKVQRADAAGKYERFLPRTEARIQGVLSLMEAILRDGDCYSLKMLAVNGNDLREAGIRDGVTIGEELQKLLEDVIEERLPNERDALLEAAKERNCE